MLHFDIDDYQPCVFDPDIKTLSHGVEKQLERNISIVRDLIIFFTAVSNARGLGGHTGGAYDVVPEALIADGFIRGSDRVHPVLYDAAGHRVALQYCLAALDERTPGISVNDLLHYREFDKGLPGHPERDERRGIGFSSGRLGHLFAYVNGVAEAHPGKYVFLLSSDGSLQEGTDAEAARYAAAHGLKVILLVDDNNVTIESHTNDYLPGFEIEKTLRGHGLSVNSGEGEEISTLYTRMYDALHEDGPAALVNRRQMAPGVPGIENSTKGHDVIPVEYALEYLDDRGHRKAADYLRNVQKSKSKPVYIGSSSEFVKNRSHFGTAVCDIIERLGEKERQNILVVSADLGGSTGVDKIGKKFPEIYRLGGVMERNGFSVAAGFGSEPGRQGIFATFSAFSEMVISEIIMARLNGANVLVHFSHAGVDDMADNVSHFGINNFFVDSGLPEGDKTRLYFPADAHQLTAVLESVFFDPGLRFIFSTRSGVPYILDENGGRFFDPAAGYRFQPGKDEVIRKGTDGYVVSYGEMLYRSLDAVERLKKGGVDIGLVNKVTLNVIDEEMLAAAGAAPFVLVVESQKRKTGLGIRYGTWLLRQGYAPQYDHIGTFRPGKGGLGEQINYQGLSPDDIVMKIKSMLE